MSPGDLGRPEGSSSSYPTAGAMDPTSQLLEVTLPDPHHHTGAPVSRLTHTGTQAQACPSFKLTAQPMLLLYAPPTHKSLCCSPDNQPAFSKPRQSVDLWGSPQAAAPSSPLYSICPRLSLSLSVPSLSLSLPPSQAVYHRGLTRAEVLTERGCGVDARCPFFSLIKKTEVIAQGAQAGISP